VVEINQKAGLIPEEYFFKINQEIHRSGHRKLLVKDEEYM